MKIAFMTSGTINGSLSYRPLAFAKELVRKGHEVYIFAPRFDKYSNFKDEGITEIDGVKIMRPLQIRTFPFELGLISYILSSITMLYRLNPDIIHINKPNPVTIPALLIRAIRKIPIILDVDDLDSEVMKIEKNSLLRIKLVQVSEKLFAHYANAVTAASAFLENLYASQYKKQIVTHVPNGADFVNMNKINTEKISDRILFIGNMNRTNILEPLFHAIKGLQDKKVLTHTRIIGDGKYLPYFKRLSKKLGLTKNVAFLGWVPQNQLYKYIRVGDIGYCYMPNELTVKACSSMKVFQYMQFGAVPLVSNVGDLPSYTFNGRAGYIAKHDDKDSLIKTLIYALKNKEERIEKIKYSQIHARSKFSWQSLTVKVEKVYQSVIEK